MILTFRGYNFNVFDALSGFPDSFILNKSEKQMYKQAGNSVTVPVVYAVAQQIVKELIK